MNNRWARLFPTEYVHPDLGTITFDGYGWMAVPRSYLETLPKRFLDLNAAKDWLESLL
jgi:hypothetical protein